MIVRWKFHEEPGPPSSYVGPIADWNFPVNPNRMDAPEMLDTISAEPLNIDGQNRDIQQPTPPKQWSFSGVLYTLADLDMMDVWVQRGRVVHLTDHFNQTWRVQLEALDAQRDAWRHYPERHTYTMSCQMLRRIA